MNTVAFIGLGRMGSGMAANQVRAGRKVRAFDLSKEALKAAEANGCAVAASVAEAVEGADAVITMLPAGEHVEAVYRDSILANGAPGTLLIDCSTIDVETARRVGALAAGKGFRSADAPVSGGTAAADAGTLAFMVGCREADFSDIDEALGPMSKAVIRAGEHGAGQAAKICNNMLLAISMIGTCEAFALADRLGLGAERFFEIAKQSSGQCWSLTAYCPVRGVGPDSPADHDYQGGFATDLMLKDLRLAQAAAMASGAVTPLGSEAQALYALLSGQGHGKRDFSVMLELMKPGTLKKR